MLAFLGIILVIIIGKFVYDTYLSNNTKDKWEDYKQENPAKAYEIERNKGLDFSTSQAAKQADAFRNLSELQQLMVRLSMDLYKRLEPRIGYFEFSVQGKRHIEQYFKSICSILSASIFAAVFDMDKIGANEPIRKQLKSNLVNGYLVFTNNFLKTNKITSRSLQSLGNNEHAAGLHAIVEMERYSAEIEQLITTGKLAFSEKLEDLDDDGDPYTYEKIVQYSFVKDIYEVGFEEVGGSIRVNRGELEYEVDECKTEINNLLYFIRSYVTQLKKS